jgi:pentatricopeptide repeat protein
VVVCIRQMEKAYALLAEMKEVGVEANSHCYNPLIMGFSTKNFDKAMAVVKEMELAGVPADVDTYRVLIFACSLSRNQDKAIQVLLQISCRLQG